MDALTDRQRLIYAQLKARGEDSLVELAARLGIHYSTLREHLGALERKGYVTLEPRGVGRSPVVRLTGTREGVPVVGRITAGPLSEALEHPEGYLRLPGYPEGYGLRVHGDSMADEIKNGDVVLLQKRPPKSGEICAVRVDGSDATMVAALKDAIDRKKDIVVTSWTPHWMWAAYKLKYLEDPKKALGGEETVNTVARKDLKKDMPEVYAILSKFKLTLPEEQQVMLQNEKQGTDPAKTASAWVSQHQDTVKTWLS